MTRLLTYFLRGLVLTAPLVVTAAVCPLVLTRIDSSTKDLLNAFVGEELRFDTPVLVALSADGAVRRFGSIAQPSLAELGLPGDVAVHIPLSYNIGGQLVAVPSRRVTPLDTVSSEVLAFIVSRGVTDVPVSAR